MKSEAPDRRILALLVGLVVLFLLDLALPKQYPVLPYYFIPGVLATAFATPLEVSVLGAVALALAIVSGIHWSFFPSTDFLTRLGGLSGVALVSVGLAAQRMRRDAGLRSSEERFRLLAENSSEVVVLLDETLGVRWVSPSLTSSLGWSCEQWFGQPIAAFFAPGRDTGKEATLQRMRDGRKFLTRLEILASNGCIHWCEAHISPYLRTCGTREGWVWSIRLVDERVASEEALERRARIDPLTHLLNRDEVFHRIEDLASQRPRTGRNLAVLFCDLDRFKQANDAFGHQAGDTVLRVTAERIRSCLRSTDLAARIGGDELLVVLPGVQDRENTLEIARKLCGLASQPIPVPGGEVSVSLSIGVALAEPFESVDALIGRADHAMYSAKRRGGGQVIVIDPEGSERPLSA